MVAKKLGIDVVHVEAGLRSFDRSMPEEINRIVTDSIADLFLVTEESGRANLLREGVAAERIHLVGNLMIDSLRQHLERARSSEIADRLGVRGKAYGVVTLHRPANVDDPLALAEILGALGVIAETLPLLWPVHPRTRARLADGSISLPAGHSSAGAAGLSGFSESRSCQLAGVDRLGRYSGRDHGAGSRLPDAAR